MRRVAATLFADLLHNESNVAAGILRFDKCCVKFGSAATKQTHTHAPTHTHTEGNKREQLCQQLMDSHTQRHTGRQTHRQRVEKLAMVAFFVGATTTEVAT